MALGRRRRAGGAQRCATVGGRASGLGEHASRRDLENAAPLPELSFVGGMRATTRLQAPSSVFVWRSGDTVGTVCVSCVPRALSKLIYLCSLTKGIGLLQ